MNLGLDNLIYVQRYSGNMLIKPESVSDHIWGMIALALEWVEKINSQLPENSIHRMELKEVIWRIVIHDIEECYTSDIPRPFKHYNKDILKSIDDTSYEILKKEIKSFDLVHDIINAKSKLSPEGRMVGYLDIIQAGEKMVTEIELGNRFMYDELDNIIENLEGKIGDLDESGYIQAIGDFLWFYVKKYKNIKSKYQWTK